MDCYDSDVSDAFANTKGGWGRGGGGVKGGYSPNISDEGAKNYLEFARGVETHPLSFYLNNLPLQYKTYSAATGERCTWLLRRLTPLKLTLHGSKP